MLADALEDMIEGRGLDDLAKRELDAEGGEIVLERGELVAARRLVAEATEPIDAVLLDLRLPDSSDLSLLATIRRTTPTTAVVMMTAHGTQEDVANAKALGAFEVVEKPFDVHQIERVVMAAYRARTASH